MMFLQNYDQLRELTAHNRTSQGISAQLAQVKQDTTKGLWYRFTSTFSEMFMRGYEIMEPQIQRTLRKLTAAINTEKFAKGLASIASALLDLFTLFGKIATWFANNYRWLEPVLFTGFAATRLFKLAGAVTNLAIAFGLLGKQKAAMTGVGLISSFTGLGGSGLLGRMSFADKRNLVGALRQAGVTGGRGALMSALAGAGVQRSLTGYGTRHYRCRCRPRSFGHRGRRCGRSRRRTGRSSGLGGIQSMEGQGGYGCGLCRVTGGAQI